ncbi:hypothetical protein GCM10009425_47500 [Pseudomonas asuensis]|uniref:Uncharacterized protein n=1 Tax=Pseudomonas asuensis TaxID=1825787 RepID=A0ABQ2H399_9PSED|nr:hypothetical protein GCM10009425_47500 [Pseudomonas asuensis]
MRLPSVQQSSENAIRLLYNPVMLIPPHFLDTSDRQLLAGISHTVLVVTGCPNKLIGHDQGST